MKRNWDISTEMRRAGRTVALMLMFLVPPATGFAQTNSDVDDYLLREAPSPVSVDADAAAVWESEQVLASHDPAGGESVLEDDYDWLSKVRVGYDNGFIIASEDALDLDAGQAPFSMRITGWGQLRHTIFNSDATVGLNRDLNQFQLKRGRLAFSGTAFTPDFNYFVQLDGRSSSGDQFRLLDYYLELDFGHNLFGRRQGLLGLRTGKYKMPFTMARYLSGRDFEFADRSVASTFFDVNRSFGISLFGKPPAARIPWDWELAVFNGLVSGGAETGSAGSLDNNFAYSGRLFWYPIGEWGGPGPADLEWHECLAARTGLAFANSTIDRIGENEFESLRVVDTGRRLSSLLDQAFPPEQVDEYTATLFAIDGSLKYRGWSVTLEYYFRNISDFRGAAVPDLYDHGYWFQFGKFVIRRRLQLALRWSRVVGNSGTLGGQDLSSDEYAGAVIWYIRDQHAKVTLDITNLNGAPINSSALDISPGDAGWLLRTQAQFSF